MSTVSARGAAAPAPAQLPRFGVARAAWYTHRRELLAAFAILGAVALLLAGGVLIRAAPARPRPQLLVGGFVGGPGYAYSTASWLSWLGLLPFVLGAFSGARLVGADLDRGTVRFAWTQGVTRTRWVIVKLLVHGLLLGGAATVTGLAFAWWDQPYATWRLDDPVFGLYPPVFAVWTVASFAFAALLGAAVRGVVAVVATTTGVTAVLASINAYLRDTNFYRQPLTRLWRDVPPGSRWLGETYTRTNGRLLSPAALDRLSQLPGGASLQPQWLAQHHVLTWATFQPSSWFWPFQLIQSSGLLALTVLFGALAVWRIRRHSVWPRAKGPA